jgi:uncharacterized protein YjdB
MRIGLYYTKLLSVCGTSKRYVSMCGFLLVFLLCNGVNGSAQTYYAVTALSGTTTVGGVSVTVTSSGSVSSYGCTPGGSYWTGSGGSGTYTWTFGTPVSSIKMHIDAQDAGDDCNFTINGVSYAINLSQISYYTPACFGATNAATVSAGNLVYAGPSTNDATLLVITPGYGINSFSMTCAGGGSGVTNDFNFASAPALTFTNGSTQSSVVCLNSSSNSINSLMAATDGSSGLTMTWSVTSGPTHGTLSGVASYTATSTGSSVVPTGMTYTPTSGYTGTDAYTIQVSDGTNTATTVVNVTVNPLPITGNTTLSTAITTTLSDATSGGVWSSANTAIGTVGSASGVVTGISAGSDIISYSGTFTGCSSSVTVTTNVTVETPNNGLNTGGVNDYVSIPNSLSAANGMTIEYWVKTTMTSASGSQWFNGNGIVDAEVGGVTNDFGTALLNNKAAFGIGSPDFTIQSVSSINTGNWTHVAATWDKTSGAMKLYINGVLEASGTGATNYRNAPPDIFIGATQTLSQQFDGTVDEVRIWNTARSQSQIQANMNCDVAQDPTLVAYYRFDEGTASGNNTGLSNALDYSGNHNCGTFVNMTLNGSTSNYVTGAIGSCNTISMTLPGAQSGTAATCVGNTTTLTNATSGGVWTSSSSNFTMSGTATSTVTITGTSAGVSNITYTLNCGTVVTPVTIYAVPAAITGNTTLSTSITTTLAESVAGGTWVSANTYVATVGSTTGVVSGVLAGTDIISYTEGALACGTVTTNVTVKSPNSGINLVGGSSNYLLINDNSTLRLSSAPLTIEFWAKPTVVDGNFHWVISKDNSNSDLDYLIGIHSSNQWRFILRNLAIDITGGPVLSAGTWYHVACTYDGSNAYLYVNGVQVGTAASAGSGVSNTANVVIGGRTGSSPYQFFTGSIDEVRIWNTARSQATIQANMNCDVSQNTNLVAYYRFDEGTAGGTNTSLLAATDYTDNNNCASFVGLSLTGGTSNYETGAIGSCNTISTSAGVNSGATSLCAGATTTYVNSVPGGVWSSSNSSIVSVNGTTGAATAGTPLSVSTATITYTLYCNTVVTTVVTVYPVPATITGSMTACPGTTTTLSDAVSGGTWTSDNTGIATVGSTGIVTGVASGSVVMTYTMPGSCTTTANVTINPLPATISGSLSLCPGVATTLTDASSGGTWTSTAGTGTAAIVGSTGAITGGSAGTVNVTYTLPTGCITTSQATVNSLPGAITGPTAVCTGYTVTLNCTPAGGTWTSSSITTGTVSPAGGVVGGISTGNVNISYTSTAGCTNSIVVTVSPTPSAITGSPAVCVGSSTPLSDLAAGGTWSTPSSSATIVGSTGVVTGVTAGNATISYTMPVTGCYVVATETVNQLPTAITGGSSVCVGLTATLNSTPGGGTWSSSDPSYGSVVSASGVVTGVSAGTLTMTYTLPTSCAISEPYTVNPTPAPITGTAVVCTGLTTTLADATTGGTWSSLSGNASVVGSTGVVTGITGSTTAAIVYTLPAGCTATQLVTVNASPTAITGASGVCVGLTTTLNSTPGTGTWTSNTATIGSVGSTSGAVTGVSTGNVNISYTLPDGCFVVQPMTVNPIPAAITGTMVVCQNSTVSLNDVTSGGTWSSSNTAVGTVNTSGYVTGISSGNTNIIYTLPGGCTATAVVTVNPVPNISVFSSSASSQCVGLGATFTVASSSLGAGSFTAIYNMSGANSATGSTSTLTMGSSTGTFTTSALANAGSTTITLTSLTNTFGCISNLSSSNTASTSSFPLPTAYTVNGTGSYCSGGAGLHVFLSNSVTGVDYQLYYNGTSTGTPIGGAPGPLDFGAETLAGTYTVIATNTTTFCVNNMSGSAVININPLPTAYAMTGGGSYCSGGTGVSIGLANSTIGVSYQLYNSATPMGAAQPGTGAAISFGPQTVSGVYTAVATNTTTACTNTMTGTATITINPLPAAITGTMNVCVSSNTTLADATAGGSWSSVNTSVGSIGSSSGVAAGVASGTTLISYTLPTGCVATATLTVNALPSAIVGVPNVCTTYSVTLTDASGGGTWTSSNTGLATIGASTGTMVGVAAGNPNITYTLPTGCMTSVNATVNTTPAALTGTMNVCTGYNTSLNSTTPGGAWSSNNVLLATVGSTGAVSGIAAGTPVISYIMPTGCYAAATVTVNTTPAAIGGTAAVCTSATTTLTDGTTGGAWSSSNTSLATVGTSGIVSGVAAGMPYISYTIPATGCYYAQQVTVNQAPAAFTGTFSVCQGLTTAIGETVSGGAWSSSNTSVATVGTAGVVTGVAAGTAIISYVMPGSCIQTVVVTVNPLPSSITGASAVCVNSNTTLTDASSGGTWSSSNPAYGTIGSASGTVTGISNGVTTITYSLTATGCITTSPLTVNPLPASITGTFNVCSGLTTTLADATGSGSWSSSNPTFATVGSASGTVTGVAAGALNITYTLPTGCVATQAFTVNASPVAITGANTVCVGLTTPLADATTGGTWSSGDISLATISGTGTVTGLSPGSVAMNYTLSDGCSATQQMTVNPQPAAVTGTLNVCTGLTVALNDVTAGGAWSSSNTAVATVGSTGIVTGVTSGLATIAYTLPAGCNSSVLMTVNPSPASITGVTNVCVGLTQVLSDASSGGVWSSSNTALGTIGSTTGVVGGISAGPLTISYTLPAGCFATTAFSVNPLPAAISGTNVVCVASSTTLTETTSGGSWSSSNTAQASVNSSGVLTGASGGTPAITYTLPSGCIATFPVTVNSLPTVYSVAGGGTYCSGGSGADVRLTNSTSGINYQLLNSGSAVGTAVAGATGFPIDYGYMTAAGNYTVVATNATTGCSIAMSGVATVSVNATPTVYSMTGGGNYCAGGSGVVVGLSNSNTGISYQLYLGGSAYGSPVAGTNSPFNFGTFAGAGTYTVVATNTTTACTANMSGIATVVINPLPNVYTMTGGGSYCAGGTGVAIGLSNSDLSANYTLYQGSTAVATVGGSGSALSLGTYTAATTYSVVATAAGGTGCSTPMLGTVGVSVNPLPTAFTVSPATGAYCAGGTGVNVQLLGSTTGFSYQLFYAGSPASAVIAGTGGTLNFGNQTGAGAYTVTATNNITGCTNTMTGSSVISINPLPNIYAVSGGGGYCSGVAGSDIQLSSSDVGINYTLSTVSGSTTTVITTTVGTGAAIDYGLRTVGTYIITASNATTSCTVNMSGSVSSILNPLPNAYAVTGTGSYCAGGSGRVVGLATSDAGINYQLYNGATPIGSAVSGTGGVLSFGLQTVAATYTVLATNATTLCTVNMSGSAIISINPLPVIYNVTGGGSYCAGGVGLHVYLSGSTSGVSYQLYNGTATAGLPQTGTGGVIDFGLHVSSGSRIAVATSGAGCTDTMSGSATIVINPLPTAIPMITGGSYCAGGAGVNVGLTGSNTGFTYQLFNSSTPMGSAIAGSGFPLSFGLETLAGTYTVIATNSTTSCSGPMSGSEIVVMNPLPANFSITGGGSYCIGGAGSHVGLSGSVSGTSYQLMLAGTSIGSSVSGTGSSIDFGAETLAGTYSVIATTSSGCSSTMSGIASVAVNPLPNVYTVSGGGNYCSGGSGVDVYLTNSDVTANYQLYNGSVLVGTSTTGTGTILDFGDQTAAGTYTVKATDAIAACSVTMTGAPTVSIDPLPTAYHVLGGGSYCPGGAGVHVTLGGSDSASAYQLYNGTTVIGSAVTSVGGSIDFGLQTIGGTYTVVATSLSSCTNWMSGSAVVSINSLPVVYDVTGGGSYCAGGAGVAIGLDGSDSHVNYALYNGGTSSGSALIGTLIGTSSTLDFGERTAAGVYTIVATDLTTGCTDTMNGSAAVTIAPLPTAYALTGGGGYCAGGSGVLIGIAGSDAGVTYQLYNGSSAVGVPMEGSGIGMSFGLQSAAGTYSVMATNDASGCTNNMSGTEIVAINPLPTAFNVTGGGSYCVGGTGYHIGLSGSVFGNNYQLYKDGVALGSAHSGTGFAIDYGLMGAAGNYTIVATNTATGCTNNMTGSAVIVINAVPNVYAVFGGGSYCPGGAGEHIGIMGSQNTVNYSLYRGTTLVTTLLGSDSTLDFGLQTAAGAYTVLASDTTTHCASTMAGSATVSVNPLPAVFSMTGGGGYCAGTPGTHVTLSGSSLGVHYQLYRGDTAVGYLVPGTGLPIDFGVFAFTGTYTAIAINSGTTCSDTMAGISLVTLNSVPVIDTVSGGGSYCYGGSGLHIMLNSSTAGIRYQLYRAGGAIGTGITGTGSGLDFGLQTVAGTYAVVATNTTTTCSSTMFNTIAITVDSLPRMYNVSGGGSYCSGGAGVHVMLSGSQSTISYQLYDNGIATGSPVSGGGSVLDFGLEVSAGTYTVIATNSATTCMASMSGSSVINISSVPVAFTVTGGGSYCSGGAGEHVGLSGSVIGINYDLYNGIVPTGVVVAGTGSAIDFGAQTAGGLYGVRAVDAVTGCYSIMTDNASIVVNALPAAHHVTGSGSYCAGSGGLHIGLDGSDLGITYRVYLGSSVMDSAGIAGTGSAIDMGTEVDAGTYTIVATNTITGCSSTMSDSASVTITALVVPSITMSTPSVDSVCSGTMVTYTATAVNGGSTPAYSWTVDGHHMGGDTSVFAYTPTGHEVVRVMLTSSAACAIPATTYDSTSMVVLSNVIPTVTIMASPGDTVCAGTSVTLTLTSTYGGSTPTFSWQLNGTPVSTLNTYTYTPSDNDVVFATMTSSYMCATDTTVLSNNARFRVNTTVAPSVTILSSAEYNAGGAAINDTLVAVTTNAGFDPGYQWSVNGNPVIGATSSRYIAPSLNNGDVVRCYVVDANSCGTFTGTGTYLVAVSNVGVNQVNNEGYNVNIVPNPNNGTFTVKGSLGVTTDETVKLQLTDMLGQVVYTAVVKATNGQIDHSISLNGSLANGMYLLGVSSGSGNKIFHVVIEK